MSLPEAVRQRLARAQRYGFTATRPGSRWFVAKPDSHDDGPEYGMFLGALGGPVVSRDLQGRFGRWHLEPGAHVLADLEQCQFRVHWCDQVGEHSIPLRRDAADEYQVHGLFPCWHERFTSQEMPFAVVLTSFAPVVPVDAETAGLPVLCFDVWLEPLGDVALPAVDVALFWPNLNAWHASKVPTVDRGDRAWPGHHHAGNRNWPASNGHCVVQGRDPDLHGPESTKGEVCLSVQGMTDTYSRHVQYKVDQNATGVPEHEQPHSFAAIRHGFDTEGRLDTRTDGSWSAHWHEPIGSAVAAHYSAGRAGAAHTRFVVAFDWPDVVFGSGRAWRRHYAREDRQSEALAEHAQEHGDDWLAAVDWWHTQRIAALTAGGWPDAVAGCVLNETNLLTSLGTIWVNGTHTGHEPSGPLRRQEHFGLLEGFDTGYFYVTTSDLWHYAFPAVSRNWPDLADLVFDDLRDALAGEDPVRRPIYRSGQQRSLLVADRLPHDMGAIQEDPFVRLNGYAMRDDPNTWRDANPAFVLSTVLHHRLLGHRISEESWEILRRAAEVVAAEVGAAGVVRHDEFGDSTWDNLGLRGWSCYATGLSVGMWAVLDAESRSRGEVNGDSQRLRAALDVLDSLWNGDHYRACSEGKYTGAIMPDSLLGIFYAELATGERILSRERVVQHLTTAYHTAYRDYHDGRVGPLLIAEPGVARHSRDGGEELQVNEVLIGAGWMFTAMLYWYGLRNQAVEVATSLRDVLYAATGLQYRSPAAVDADGRFRAPLNMRPLAVWWLDVVTELSAKRR